MGRFLLTVLLGLGIFIGVAWYFDLWPKNDPRAPSTSNGNTDRKPKPGRKPQPPPTDLGEPLYPAPQPEIKPDAAPRFVRVDPVVIPGQLAPVDKIEVSSEVDGALLFIGEEAPDAIVAVAGVLPFMADPFRYTTINMGDRQISKFYRRLQEGMSVETGQMVAMLNPIRAALDLATKKAKVRAAEAEHLAAKGIMDESEVRWKTNQDLYNRAKAVSREEVSLSKVTFDKYFYEWKQKGEGIRVAQTEQGLSEYTLSQHEIRNKIFLPSSKINVIYKNSGDTVKANEPIMQLVAGDFLQAQAMVDIQYANRIRRAGRVRLEPSQEEAPVGELKAHHGEITSVAITKDGGILSGSEDRTVRLWSRPVPVDRDSNLLTPEQARKTRPWNYTPPQVKRELKHDEAVRVVAASPASSKINWCAVGCVDGTIWVWNLDEEKSEPIILRRHNDAVYALAFSPDGQWFASGGADNAIYLWRTETAKEEFAFDANHGVESSQQHQGAITSLHFTPQTKLVSAGRDGSLRVWDLYQKGARLSHREDGRSGGTGSVAQLGVDGEGKWMIYDKNSQELQILSVEDGRYLCSLQNPQGAIPFETVAVFSADASLMLTAGAQEGRIQLWQTPTSGNRGFEVRQYVPSSTDNMSSVTCAAFANDAGLQREGDGSFVVTGSKSGSVYVWAVPNKTDVDQHRLWSERPPRLAANQENVRQIRVTVELPNPRDEQHPEGRFAAGRPVTIVIE